MRQYVDRNIEKDDHRIAGMENIQYSSIWVLNTLLHEYSMLFYLGTQYSSTRVLNTFLLEYSYY